MALNCFRYFHFTSFKQVDDLTLHEWKIMQKALSYRLIDQERTNHQIAYESFRATSTKTMGKSTYPVYKTFKQFYDYEEQIKRLDEQYEKKEGRKEDPYADLIAYKRSLENK